MRTMNATANDPGFITLCIQLAQSTFSDVMPSKQEAGGKVGPKIAALAVSEPRSFFARIDDWFYRQQVNAREAYLAQSTDIFDLEARIRHLERRPYY
jgi:Protein of unknown function (DUF3563)